MPSPPTRTLNPLHFEDLEPHRFEDMVRQLAYDFRPWRSIEATGRLGADEGKDIRATEVVGRELSPAGDEEEDDTAPAEETRVWVIQCKREKKLGPADVRRVVKDAVPRGGDPPYGFILAAACDFSTKARHAFQQEAVGRGVREMHVWGKAELEDMLFLPKYDHLLFAYFGISLQVRRRSLKAEVRSRLSMKRKLSTVLGGVRRHHNKDVFLRDPREARYPDAERILDFYTRPRWHSCKFLMHYPPDHLTFVVGKFFAYVDDNNEHWDAAFVFNDQDPKLGGDRSIKKLNSDWYAEREVYRSWWDENIPRQNRASYLLVGFVHYDRVIAVDEDGDAFRGGPHLLVEFGEENGPFDGGFGRSLECEAVLGKRQVQPHPDKRVAYFPAEFREIKDLRFKSKIETMSKERPALELDG